MSESIVADDLLIGAKAIGAFLGLDERQVRWQLESDQIPHAKLGRQIISWRSVLRQRFGAPAQLHHMTT